MCTVQFPYGSCQLPRRLREPRCGHAALRRSSFEKRRLYYSIAPRRDNPLPAAPHTLARECLAWLWTSALYCVPLMAALGQSRHELRPCATKAVGKVRPCCLDSPTDRTKRRRTSTSPTSSQRRKGSRSRKPSCTSKTRNSGDASLTW